MSRRRQPAVLAPAPGQGSHWTHTVYRQHADLFYEVEAALFQNEPLTRQEIDRVVELGRSTGIPLASPIADLACGPGRHSLELARRGFVATGVDLSEPFLWRARRAAAGLGPGALPPRFLCGDLRRLALADRSVEAVLLLGNSFGYFSDRENRAILEQMRRILRPGGLLCMEVTHRDAYLATLVPYEQEYIHTRPELALHCQWWKSWDPVTRRVETLERHCRAESDEEPIYEGSYDMRLYGWAELRRLLLDAGFREPRHSAFSPGLETLEDGLGETFGAMGEVLFVAARG